MHHRLMVVCEISEVIIPRIKLPIVMDDYGNEETQYCKYFNSLDIKLD